MSCPYKLPSSCISLNSKCYDQNPRCIPGMQLCPDNTLCPESGFCNTGTCAAIYNSEECSRAGLNNCGDHPRPPPIKPPNSCRPGVDMCVASLGKKRQPGLVKCPENGICPGELCTGNNVCPDGKACPYNGICPDVYPHQQHCNPFSNPRQVCLNGKRCPANCGDIAPPYNDTSWCPCPH